MRIRLLALGSRTEDWLRDGVREYANRLPRELRFEIDELPLAARPAGADPGVAIRKEGERVLGRLKPGDHLVALDERGTAWSSRALATELGRWEADQDQVVLVIGGPDGLAPEVLARANQRWSLSALTLPHGIVRLLVVEQLYRAVTIRRGHPYHKD
jgi:23S rRNA (pseudouridine1915-N3)-methyltransferase